MLQPPRLLPATAGVLLAFVALSAGCSVSPQPQPPAIVNPGLMAKSELPRDSASTVSAEAVRAVVAADNAFAFDLFGKVRAGAAGKNAMLSPLSISLGLSMAYAGAEGTTAAEMARALHFDAAGPSLHAGHNALSQALETRGAEALKAAQDAAKFAPPGMPVPSPDDYRLHIVDAVWGDRHYPWETPFLDTLARNYGTGVWQADFMSLPEVERVRINDWVSAETNTRTHDLLPVGVVTDATRMVLVNAMQLKLPWMTPFEKTATKAGDFARGDGATVSADYMYAAQSLSYFEDAEAQVVALPLFGNSVSLVVAVPKGALGTFESGLSAARWNGIRDAMARTDVQLKLPRFTFTSDSLKLSGSFQSLGMIEAFDAAKANFFGMCRNPPNGQRVYLGEVVHKATMAVDESGVEVAASAPAFLGGGGPPPAPKVMTVNRPFVVALVDEPTGAILFLGNINDPSDRGGP